MGSWSNGFFKSAANGRQPTVADLEALKNQLATAQAISTITGASPLIGASGLAMAQAQQQTSVRFGHDDATVNNADSHAAFFYIERDPSPEERLLPAFQIKEFRIAYNVREDRQRGITIPSEVYASRADAEAGVRSIIRARLAELAGTLVSEITNASFSQGLVANAELDLTDALRKYLEAVKS